MINTLINIASFLLAIIILVGVHEFGHFWVARKLGVKVLRFSIGFGTPLWKTTGKKDNTEYVLAMIPLGGYVKMLDEREGDVPASEQHRAFNRQSLAVRSAIVAAGPLINILLAIVVYWVVLMIGTTDMRPMIDEPALDSRAHVAGLQRGDEIVAVGDTQIVHFGQVFGVLSEVGLDQPTAMLTVKKAQGEIIQASIDVTGMAENPRQWFEQLGIAPYRLDTPAEIHSVSDNSPAKRANVQEGDTVIAINQQPITSTRAMIHKINENAGVPLDFTIVDRSNKQYVVRITPEAVEEHGKTLGRIGIAVSVYAPVPKELQVHIVKGPFDALVGGVEKTWQMTTFIFKMIGKMLVGEASFKENIGGPISIAKMAGGTMHAGLLTFLGFLAVISVSLGVFNLLPVPMLDGGHLLFYAIELVKGSPLSETTEAFFQRVGMALVLTLMVFALYVDILRHL
jgi:regulator of sigma E protease